MSRNVRGAWATGCIGRVAFFCSVAATVITLYSQGAVQTITQRYGGTDGAELAAVAISGGVAHPSGYPLYIILARIWLHAPLHEAAGRLALLSVWAAALGLACTSSCVIQSVRPDGWGLLGGSYAVFAAATTERLWSQAVIAEVYALNLFWLVVCVLFVTRWLATPRLPLLMLSGLCFGLGLGVHLTIVAIVPAGLLAWIVTTPRVCLSPRHVFLLVCTALVGSISYAYLPSSAARYAVPSWGDPQTFVGFWHHVSGAEYRYLVGVVSWPQRFSRLSFALRDLLDQPGPLAVLLALGWGLPYGWHSARPLLAMTGTVAVANLLFAISYGAADGTVYLLPWTWAWCVWAGIGAATLGHSLATFRSSILARGALIGVLALSIVWYGATRYAALNLHNDTSERERVLANLHALAPNALFISNNDADTFGVWYVQRALHVRQDVLVVDARLIHQPWYRAQLARQLRLTDAQQLCAALNTRYQFAYVVAADGSWRATQLQTACPHL